MKEKIINRKYEYKVVELKERGVFITKLKLEDLEAELNYQGEKGWELTSSFSTDLDINGRKQVILIFRREYVELEDRE